MHILTFTTLFPNSQQPVHAVFVRNRMDNFTKLYHHEWTIVAPVPYFPRWAAKIIEHYSPRYAAYARMPREEKFSTHTLYHPRYLVLPKVGMKFHAKGMARGAKKLLQEIHRKNPIAIIDAHYVYPDGTAAIALGKILGIPVIVSARGTDLNVFPHILEIKPQILQTLKACTRLISVSSGLQSIALNLGLASEKSLVIGNGVDTQLFKAIDNQVARTKLALPLNKKIVLSVGHLVELKGFHLIVQAIAQLENPELYYVIVGEGPERPALEKIIKEKKLESQILLVGAVGNQLLPNWYSAADIFILASSREGWPNVVCEAQAIGLPVIATPVSGVPEIIYNEDLGILLKERSVDAIADALNAALQKKWDYSKITTIGQGRSWDTVSVKLQQIFTEVIQKN